jgi:photosystem II stability/assembly factor-like uncharacterized protein
MIERDERGGQAPSIPPDDCTVLSIAAAEGSVWAATDAGLWRWCSGVWRQSAVPPAIPVAGAVARAGAIGDTGGALLVAGLAGGVQYSPDGGKHWSGAWIDEVASSVTCFAVSPRFAIDRVVLAGTEGDGVLRSADGGRRWRLSNFGLAGYTILALAAPPGWGRREEIFVATDEGIYRSPNAGRAWQRADAGLETAAQALALSPQFAVDRTLYAGGEGAELYRSVEAGRSWHLWSAEVHNVNCLWVAPDDPLLLVAGSGDGAILRSVDGGRGWECGWQGADAVLALAESGGVLYAGLYQGGLLVSLDRGCTWRRPVAVNAGC